MNHTYLVRGAAAAAVIGMLSVSAPAFAQTTTQSTQPATQSGSTSTTTNPDQKVTGRSYASCRNTIVAPGSGQFPVTSKTSNSQSTAPSTGNSESTNVGTPNSGSINGGTAVGNRGTGTMNVNGTCKAKKMTTTPSGATTGMPPVAPTMTRPMRPAHPMQTNGTPYTTAPSTTWNRSTMKNTLTDNPNGPAWLRKFNRPAVIAKNRKNAKTQRTNALGTTTPPRPRP